MPNSTDGRRIISVSVPEQLHSELARICKEQDLPVSIYVRHLINRAVREDAGE